MDGFCGLNSELLYYAYRSSSLNYRYQEADDATSLMPYLQPKGMSPYCVATRFCHAVSAPERARLDESGLLDTHAQQAVCIFLARVGS